MKQDFTIKALQKVINELNLNEIDILYNIRMPLKSCKICGGNGVSKWDNQDAILCDCIMSIDDSREHMPFGVLYKLHNLKKKEVYNE